VEAVEFLGRYLDDGHLSCPDEVVRKLGLEVNSVVKVKVMKDSNGELKEKKRFAGIWKDMEEEGFRQMVEIPKLRKDYFAGRDFGL